MTAIPMALAGPAIIHISPREPHRPNGLRSRIRDRRRDLNLLAYENIIDLVLSTVTAVKSDCVSLSLSLSLSLLTSFTKCISEHSRSLRIYREIMRLKRTASIASGYVAGKDLGRFHFAWISDGQASNSHNRVHTIEESRVVAHEHVAWRDSLINLRADPARSALRLKVRAARGRREDGKTGVKFSRDSTLLVLVCIRRIARRDMQARRRLLRRGRTR